MHLRLFFISEEGSIKEIYHKVFHEEDKRLWQEYPRGFPTCFNPNSGAFYMRGSFIRRELGDLPLHFFFFLTLSFAFITGRFSLLPLSFFFFHYVFSSTYPPRQVATEGGQQLDLSQTARIT